MFHRHTLLAWVGGGFERGFLKAHGIYQEYTLEDFEQERQALKELGF
jgi:hypothetical protein